MAEPGRPGAEPFGKSGGQVMPNLTDWLGGIALFATIYVLLLLPLGV